MKPILKKLHSHAESDRTASFDTERDWDDQPSPLSFPPLEYYGTLTDQTAAAPSQLASLHGAAANGPADFSSSRPTRDVSFSLSSTSSADYNRSGRFKHTHIRSTSGTSHASIATSTSGRNGSSFVHPFQQTPRTATPPLSYANSIASQDTTTVPVSREYASAISENEDSFFPYTDSYNTYSDAAVTTPPLYSTFGGSQRSSSHSDSTPTLRQAPALRSNSGPVSRMNPAGLNRSLSDVQASSLPRSRESPLSATAPHNSISPLAASSTPSSATPLSPLRNSLDMSGFRLRSRSEVDTVTRQEQVREARRKFEAREKAKDEKHAQRQLRKRERADNKEAGKHDRARLRKGSSATTSVSSSTGKSSSQETRSRKSTGQSVMREKADFASNGYDAAATGQAPMRAEEVQFQTPKRQRTAKRKTTGVWTAFMLWFRTRLLKMGRR